MKSPRSVTRQELSKLQVTDADAFTGLRFLRHRDATPALPELEERGDHKHPGTVGTLADLYHALWASEPNMREDGDVLADRRWWRQLLAQTVSTAGYQELHAATELSDLKSVLGTVAMGETIVGSVSKEDSEKLQQVAEAQAEANDAAQAASDAQAQADALASAADDAAAGAGSGFSTGSGNAVGQSANGQSQPTMGQKSGQASGTGSPTSTSSSQFSPQQAQKLADELTDEWEKAEAKAEAAKAKADAAQAKADAIAQDMLGEPGSDRAEEKMRELARIGLAALRDAQAKVEEVSDTIEAWGLDEGELSQEGIPESIALLERMRRNTAFKQFAALLGRIRKIAAKKARSKQERQGVRVTRQETGRDIRRAVPRELVALAHPALRTKALTRWSRGELTLRGEESKPRLGHGPVIVCEDGSGSMDGAKQQWAKAVTLSLAHYAKLQKRGFGWMLFDYGVRQLKTYPAGKLSGRELLEIAEARSGGGTDFESPLRKAVEMIAKAGLKKADIVIVTDGDSAVSEKFLADFKAVKRLHEFNVVAVICDAGGHVTDATVKKFSDRVEKVSSFSAEEAEQKVFNKL